MGQEAVALVGQAANSITQDERTKQNFQTHLNQFMSLYLPLSFIELSQMKNFYDKIMSHM